MSAQGNALGLLCPPTTEPFDKLRALDQGALGYLGLHPRLT